MHQFINVFMHCFLTRRNILYLGERSMTLAAGRAAGSCWSNRDLPWYGNPRQTWVRLPLRPAARANSPSACRAAGSWRCGRRAARRGTTETSGASPRAARLIGDRTKHPPAPPAGWQAGRRAGGLAGWWAGQWAGGLEFAAVWLTDTGSTSIQVTCRVRNPDTPQARSHNFRMSRAYGHEGMAAPLALSSPLSKHSHPWRLYAGTNGLFPIT